MVPNYRQTGLPGGRPRHCAAGPVAGLTRADFEVLEDGQRREIAAFAAGEFPLTLALGVDRSLSMSGEPLRLAKQASRAFLSSLGPLDRSMVVAIGNEAEVIAPLSTDRDAQLRAIDGFAHGRDQAKARATDGDTHNCDRQRTERPAGKSREGKACRNNAPYSMLSSEHLDTTRRRVVRGDLARDRRCAGLSSARP